MQRGEVPDMFFPQTISGVLFSIIVLSLIGVGMAIFKKIFK